MAQPDLSHRRHRIVAPSLKELYHSRVGVDIHPALLAAHQMLTDALADILARFSLQEVSYMRQEPPAVAMVAGLRVTWRKTGAAFAGVADLWAAHLVTFSPSFFDA
jgi:hypothetical protein